MSTKVFVGNIAFRMTDQALQEAFSECGGVKSGVIITRGRRSLGYGFVEFDSTEVAVSAVEIMNRKELFGRPIKVELAKDPATVAASTPPRSNNRRKPNQQYEESGALLISSPPGVSTLQSAGEDAILIPKKNPRNRRPKPLANNNNNNYHTNYNTNTNNTITTTTTTTTTPNKPLKKVIPKSERIPSKTTLFVANLPFSAEDDHLKQIFVGTNLKDAHVVRTRNGRSRGYGFVEFHNEADQLEALEQKNGIEVDGEKGRRIISVTISNSVSSTDVDGTVPAPAIYT